MARAGSMRRAAGGSRAELWTWPGTAAGVAVVAALVLTEVRPVAESRLARFAWPGDADSAIAVLQTVATSAVTALTLTFSLTVVAMQLASQQFSPRLLRDFIKDRVTKVAMAALVGAFVFAVTATRGVTAREHPPGLAILLALTLAALALAALLAFISHFVRRLRVDTMMLNVHDETDHAIAAFHPDRDADLPSPDRLRLPEADGTMLEAPRSGFVQRVDVAGLVGAAADADLLLRVDVRPGDHVVRGTPAAVVWGPGGSRASGDAVGAAREAVEDHVRISHERVIEQDVAFGFRQLTDIAVRALSPGINDPVTAAHAIGHMADLLVRLLGTHLGPTLHADDDGTDRVVVGDRDLRYYLDLVCGQVRRYGEREPTVLTALLRMLRDVAVHARDRADRAEIERQVGLVLLHVPGGLPDEDRENVERLAARARAALAGDLREAYRDRAGETRSL